jgi:hypothetical protein
MPIGRRSPYHCPTGYETDETIPPDAENWGGEELLDWYYDVA